jgi:hypothetical protein
LDAERKRVLEALVDGRGLSIQVIADTNRKWFFNR